MAMGRRDGDSERLDSLLVARGLAPTRAKAQALILAGLVVSGGRRLDKPGMRLPRDAPLEVAPSRRYVSRGGHKLAPVLEAFGILVRGREALDVGASTGGFTQVLLEAGARTVIALDVGRGQLDWSLRNYPRVIVLEGINARELQVSDLPLRPSLAVVDVSFISLERVLPAIAACLDSGGEIVALVKPQFEVGRGRVGKGGVVRDRAVRREVLERIAGWSRDRSWGVLAVAASSVSGAEGNVEFFLHLAPGRVGLGEEALAGAIARAAGAGSGA